MKYCAKTNTADPKTGFITKGEYLTDQQAEALGEEKLRDMVARGILSAEGGSPRTAEPPAEPAAEEPDAEPEAPEEPEAEDAEEADDADDAEETEDELPELDAGDVIEDEPPAKPAKRGGRKAK